MTPNWEGEIKGNWVWATYHMGWDVYGKDRVVIIDSYRVFDKDGCNVDMDLLKSIEDSIEEEKRGDK